MKTIEFIVLYLRDEATDPEIDEVRELVKRQVYEPPKIEGAIVLRRLTEKCQERRSSGEGKLSLVKYIKDVTGWGLKDCKDWAESIIKF